MRNNSKNMPMFPNINHRRAGTFSERVEHSQLDEDSFRHPHTDKYKEPPTKHSNQNSNEQYFNRQIEKTRNQLESNIQRMNELEQEQDKLEKKLDEKDIILENHIRQIEDLKSHQIRLNLQLEQNIKLQRTANNKAQEKILMSQINVIRNKIMRIEQKKQKSQERISMINIRYANIAQIIRKLIDQRKALEKYLQNMRNMKQNAHRGLHHLMQMKRKN